MELYLAESGGCLNAYIYPYFRGESMDVYMAGGAGDMKCHIVPTLSRLRERESADMDVYIAGIEGREVTFKEETPEDTFRKSMILQSFFNANKFTEDAVIPNVSKFLLDSGAFSFFTGSKDTDWDKYLRDYADFINRNKVDRFFELDIDSLVGYDKVLEMRKALEKMTDKPCIPVWHKSRGKEAFIQMCKDYDYVSIGGIVSKEISKAEYKYFPWFIDKAHKHGAKIHGLGFTVLADLPKYHFDSVDSTSWVSGNRFGTIYQFTGTTLIKHDRPEGTRLADAKTVAVHNFTEWVKFQQYAKTHL